MYDMYHINHFGQKNYFLESNTLVSLSGSNPLCANLCAEIENLGEVIFLDVPFEELSKRLKTRPTTDAGLAGEVAYDAKNPNLGIKEQSASINKFLKSNNYETMKNFD